MSAAARRPVCCTTCPGPLALAAGLCGVAGMLPDIDSDSGRPLHESLAFAAAVVPMMLLHRLRHWEVPHELLILAGAGAYLLVRFGLGFLLKHCTVHRGMFHSLPAAAIFGEIAFLLAPSDDLGRSCSWPVPSWPDFSRTCCSTRFTVLIAAGCG